MGTTSAYKWHRSAVDGHHLRVQVVLLRRGRAALVCPGSATLPWMGTTRVCKRCRSAVDGHSGGAGRPLRHENDPLLHILGVVYIRRFTGRMGQKEER